jgi:hypothetical protein
MTSILSSSTVGLRPAWLCSKSKAELGKMFSDSDVATVTKTSFWGTYEWLAGSHDPGPLHPSNRVFYSRPKREKAEDVINITELRGLIMDKIAQSNPDSVRDYSGFLMSCKTTMSETTAKLIMARIALVSPAPQFMGTCTASLMSHFVTCLLIFVVYIIALCSSINTTTFFSLYVRGCPVLDLTALNTPETQRWSAKYMAPVRITDPSHLPDMREGNVELPISMFSEQWKERYEAARPNHFHIHQWLSSDIRVNEDVPLGTLPVDQLTIWTYKDMTDENAVAKFIEKCTYNFSDTIRRMHKTYKLNKQGVRSTKAGTRLFPSDSPLKAPQITFQWGEIIHGHYFSTSYIGRVDLPPYWKAEGVVNGTLVVGVKWERQVPWEFDQSTHKEHDTALSKHPDNIVGLANMNF